MGGLEPPTSASQTQRASRLRYTPVDEKYTAKRACASSKRGPPFVVASVFSSSRALFFVIASAARRSAFQLFLVILNAVKDLSVFLFLRGNNTGGNKSPPAQRGRRREDEKILRFAQNDNVPVRTSRHCKPFHSSSRGAERRLCPSHCGRVWRFHFYHIFGLASKRDDLPFSNQADCHTVLPQTWLGWLNT